jgi:hypothetical protein
MRKLSKLQSDVHSYMVDFFKENDQLPPVQSICNEFHKFPNQIQEMLVSFGKKGLIERNAVGKWRFARGNE